MSMKNKSLLNEFNFYILFFFFLSFVGWIWEVILYLFMLQSFVNRGVLLGPWLPIYGFGGILLTVLLHDLKRSPVLIFILSSVIGSILEYLTSWALEIIWGIRWWDYDTFWGNINGRICIAASLLFGVAGLILHYFLIPVMRKINAKMPCKWQAVLAFILLVLFIPDYIYSFFSPNIGDGIAYSCYLNITPF